VTDYVLDASALLAAFFGEEGAEKVEEMLPRAVIGAVNLSEVVAKLQDRGVPDDEIDGHVADLDLEVIAFDRLQAVTAGRLRRETSAIGLSLGDRCCLALAVQRGAVAVTTDRAWSSLALPATVEVIR
jgi:PIN domain nuclease of toxin-antitoxin system